MATTMSLTTLVRRVCAGGSAAALVHLAMPGFARADVCLDASEEARAAMRARRLLEARAKLRLCAASECEADVRAICEERLSEVSERMPTVIFDAKKPDGADLSDVTTRIDDVPRPDVAMGLEVALDPGPHVVVLRDPEGIVVERRIVVVEREKARRERVVFGAKSPPVLVPQAPTRVEVPVLYAPSRSALWMHDGAMLSFGGAAVATVLGSVFGVVAITQNDTAGCDASNVCLAPDARSRARMSAAVSTASFVTAVGLVAAGITLLVWPKAPPRLVRTSMGAGAGFRF